MPKKTRKELPPLFRRRENQLTPKQNAIRRVSLEVLSEARQTGRSLSKLAREKSISPITVIKYTNAFRKKEGRWIAKKLDHIPRTMLIYENGKEKSIETSNSKYASTIGEYHNAVKEYLNSGDSDALNRFKKKRIKDVHGKYHRFDTDPKAIKAINEAIEEPEFYEIYSP
jgi:hypothetical protein